MFGDQRWGIGKSHGKTGIENVVHHKDSVMPTGLGISDIYIFILAGFLGFQLISRIPPLLHTPLMAATNAISGIALVGSIVVAGENYNMVTNVLAYIAVTCSTINVVGGFLITDRILKMFKKENKQGKK
jgi:H+-translocating NAD(P) transhydrogenase subunit alpha